MNLIAAWFHRRNDRITREHDEAIGKRVAAELKDHPEPLTDSAEAVRFFASLTEDRP